VIAIYMLFLYVNCFLTVDEVFLKDTFNLISVRSLTWSIFTAVQSTSMQIRVAIAVIFSD